jgi:hypothetical protein
MTRITREEATMFEDIDARWVRRRREPWKTRSIAPQSIELWRLHGARDEVRGLAMETSFGYALGVELDTELVLKFLQPDLDHLIAYADRIEAALLANGWQAIQAHRARKEEA